jgi:glycosyltransferase involved in cell wall biosynthesis
MQPVGLESTPEPLFVFFVPTYLSRGEDPLHRVLSGMRGIRTHVLAEHTENLDEFPTASIHAVRESWNLSQRAWAAAVRRLPDQAQDLLSLDRTVVRAMARHLNRLDVGLYYTHFVWHATELLDVLERLRSKTPLVFMVGGSDVTMANHFGPRYRERIRDCFQRATLILCASEFLKQKALELGAPEEKLKVHYVGVPLPAIQLREQRPASASFKMLAVSRITEVKGLPYTLRAFARVAAAMPRATLEILGRGRMREECESLSVDLGIGDRVFFRGEVTAAAVRRAMAEADLFVQHSIKASNGSEEGLGWSIVEAAAHGLPVVATRSGGIPETVLDGVTGVLVDPTNERSMGEAVVEFYRDPARCILFGAAGRFRVEQEFNLAIQNQRLRRLLLAAAKPPSEQRQQVH